MPRSRNSDLPIHCLPCGKKFNKRTHYKWHMLTLRHTETAKPNSKCPVSKNRTDQNEGMGFHLYYSHGKLPCFRNCNICGKRFNNRSSLVMHSIKHPEYDHTRCPICRIQFLQNSVLQSHVKNHQKKNPLFCLTCASGFDNRESLFQHNQEECRARLDALQMEIIAQQRLGRGSERTWRCHPCSTLFCSSNQLERHLRTPNHARKVREVSLADSAFIPRENCPMCERQFTGLMQLQDHVQEHTREQPYSCQTCGLTFNLRARLNFHRREGCESHARREESPSLEQVTFPSNLQPVIPVVVLQDTQLPERTISHVDSSIAVSTDQGHGITNAVYSRIMMQIEDDEKLIRDKQVLLEKLKTELAAQKCTIAAWAKLLTTPQESHGTLDDQASSSSVQAYIAERIGLENAAIATKSDQINQLDEELQAFQLMMEQKRKLLQ